MEINSIHSYQNKTAFGCKYRYEDIMSIMSDSYIIGRNEDSFVKTAAGILGKNVEKTVEGRARDIENAKVFLLTRFEELKPFAVRFKKKLDSICLNHQFITKDDANMVVSAEIKNFGNKFIDI